METLIAGVYDELNAPGADRLRRVLESRGHAVSKKDVADFVRRQSERQVQAPRYKFDGKIAAHDLHDRWFADLVDFTAAPSDGGKKVGLHPTDEGEKYILVVQDVFSRKLWTEALINKVPKTVAEAFLKIVQRAGKKPRTLTTDEGPEFDALFRAFVEGMGISLLEKKKIDINALATLDVAIGNLKKALARDARRNATDDWASRLQKVTDGQNALPNDDYLEGAAPNGVQGSEDLIRHLKEKNFAFSEYNRVRAEKRGEKLEEAGRFRGMIDAGGWVTRGFKPRWGEAVLSVGGVDGAYVRDTEGNEQLSKFALVVPQGTTIDAGLRRIEKPGSAQTEAKQRRTLQPVADAVADRIGAVGAEIAMWRLGDFLKERGGFPAIAREARINLKSPVAALLRVYPERFRVTTPAAGGTATVRRLS